MGRWHIATTVLCLLWPACTWGQRVSIPLQPHRSALSVAAPQERATRVTMHLSFDELQAHVSTAPDGHSYVRLGLDAAVPSGREGCPELPCIKRLVALPLGAKPTVRVLGHTSQEIALREYKLDAPVLPVQPPQSKAHVPDKKEFIINTEAYSTNAYLLPSEIASVRVLGNMRGACVALVEVRAVNYNPTTNSILVHNDIDISIDFQPPADGALSGITARTSSPYFDALYDLMAGSSTLRSSPSASPIRMLIVAHRMFEQALRPFVRWKRQKGFDVEVAYTDRIGHSPNEIKHYIHDAYKASTPQRPAPTFLLLVGDVDLVPASALGTETDHLTDLYYACVDDDFLPDMLYGRMSAQTIEQLQHIIDKVLLYEQYAFADPTYLNRATLIAGEDDYWNPIVGQPTMQYATRHYFNPSQGYTTVNEYGVDHDPSNPNAQRGYNGCYGSEQMAVGYINYTAHGSETSWLAPALSTASVLKADNTMMYPFVVANCCLSADFGYAHEECLGETWIRAPQRGAVTYIGSAPNSYWYNDAYWAMGAFAAAETGSGASLNSSTMGAYDAPFHSDYVSAAGIMFAGNLAVTQAENSGYVLHKPALFQWQAYNVLGDPSLVPHFAEGHPMSVRYPKSIALGQRSFTVQAPVGAYVAISLDTVLLDAALADPNGMAHLSIPQHIDECQMAIVVTKPQHIPHRGAVQIVRHHGAVLLANSLRGQAISGSTFGAAVELTNVGNGHSGTGTIALTGGDAHMACPNPGPHPLPSIAPNDTILIDSAFTFSLSDSVPDQHRAQFDLALSTADTTWTSRVWLTAQAPALKVIDVSMIRDDNGNEVLDVGETAQVAVRIRNEGHAMARDVRVELRPMHQQLQATGPTAQTASIAPDSTAELRFDVRSLPTTAEGTRMGLTAHAAQGHYADSLRIELTAGHSPMVQAGVGRQSSNSYPFYNYRQLGRTQLLLHRHEVSPAPRQIVQLALHIAEVGQLPTINNLTISIIETDADALGPSFADTTGRAQVFSAATFALPRDTGWLAFDLGRGFPYSGLRNLLIEIDFGPNSSTAMRGYYAATCSQTAFASVVHGVGDLNLPMGTGSSARIRPNVRLGLAPPQTVTHDVSFELLDEQLRPLPNAWLRLGTASKRTDAQGKARFGAVVPQRYTYSAEHPLHVPVQGQLGPQLASDTTIRITLDRYNLLRFIVADTAAPIANATLHIDGAEHSTGPNGIATVRLGDGSYPYTVHKAHHTPVDGTVNVHNDTLDVHVQLRPHPRRWLTIVLTDDEGHPVPNAAITIQNQTLITDALGMVRFELFGNDTYPYTAEHHLFEPHSGSYSLLDTDATIAITMHRHRAVRFSITDGENPVAGATVRLAEKEAYTDSTGIAVFRITNGRYTYTLSKHGYVGLSGQPITINSDTLVCSSINRLNTLIFSIIDNTDQNPIADALVRVNGTVLSTDQNGRTQLRLVNDTYSYSVQHLAYQNFTGQVGLHNADTEVVVRMGHIASAVPTSSVAPLRIHPNPTNGELWVELPEAAEVLVHGTDGTLMLRQHHAAGTVLLDMARWPSGVYVVKAGHAVAKVVKL
ncbi:MAG: hypothetical protein IJU72_03000 [Bacteroidales bacterium]|nr:hypothetical protein [Bacteroidales bacterium]